MKLDEAKQKLITDLENNLDISLTPSEKSIIERLLREARTIPYLPPKWLRENPDELKLIMPWLDNPDEYCEFHLSDARSLYLFLYLDDGLEVHGLGKGGNSPRLKEKFRYARKEALRRKSIL